MTSCVAQLQMDVRGESFLCIVASAVCVLCLRGKMESTSAKVELYKASKVKLPMAELDYLKQLCIQLVVVQQRLGWIGNVIQWWEMTRGTPALQVNIIFAMLVRVWQVARWIGHCWLWFLSLHSLYTSLHYFTHTVVCLWLKKQARSCISVLWLLVVVIPFLQVISRIA